MSNHEILKERVESGNVAIVIGTGLSIAATDNEKYASWSGLLENGVLRALNVNSKLEGDWKNDRISEIESGVTNQLIDCAGEISKALGGNSSSEFSKWISETIGNLVYKNKDLINAVYDLDNLILTTNYDSLITQVTGLPPVTWSTPSQMDRVIRREDNGIVHLHGHWKIPESIIFDAKQYDAIIKDSYSQAVMRALHGTKTLVLIGFGAGLEDPNLGNLFEWIKEVYKETDVQIFRLVRDKEISKPGTSGLIINVMYGTDFEDLPWFLWDLAPSRISHPAAKRFRAIIRSKSKMGISDKNKFKLEWIIASALDNGYFQPAKKQNNVDPIRRSDSHVKEALEELFDVKIIQNIAPSKKLSLASEVFLSDIDTYVLPAIEDTFELEYLDEGDLLEIRGSLKELAQKKASKRMWNVVPDGVIFREPERTPDKLEDQTINLIKNATNLRVVSEYGTWMRKDPFREPVLNFINTGGTLEIVLSEPPPQVSEGYNEWIDSVHILLSLGAKIFVSDRGRHKNHMNIGNGEAVSLIRDATENSLEKAYVNESTDVEALISEFNRYKNSKFTVAIDEWFVENPMHFRGDEFEILALGHWKKDSLSGKWTDKKKVLSDSETSSLIEKSWIESSKNARVKNQKLSSEKLARLDNFAVQADKLLLNLSSTSYRDYLGTNRQIDALKNLVGSNKYREYMSNPLAITICVITKDHQVVFGKRSLRTFEHPGYWHFPSGHVSTENMPQGNSGDIILSTVYKELEEELTINPNTVENVVCLGLFQSKYSEKPELVFSAEIEETLPELHKHDLNFEHREIMGISETPENIFDFLSNHKQSITPSGKAGILIYGNSRFGAEWFVSVLDYLKETDLS